MKKEFNLSKMDGTGTKLMRTEDVKEFIWRLKQELDFLLQNSPTDTRSNCLEFVDKLAGEELVR